MSSFDLSYIITNAGAKLKFFINYLLNKYSLTGPIIDDTVLMSVTEEDVIDSLEAYIPGNATAQITAQNFISNVKTFFSDLNSIHSIRCDLFMDNERLRHLSERAESITAELRVSIPKGVASDDQYENLLNGIYKYISTFREDDLYADIDSFHTGSSKNAKNYILFVSVIATKLVLNYALSNKSLIKLDLDSIDMINSTIHINNLYLPLYDIELRKLFGIYLSIREYIFKINGKMDNNRLFIKPDGEPYAKPGKDREIQPDYMSLFQIMSDMINNRKAQPFADRRIVELYEYGFDLYTLYIMTDKVPNTLLSLIKKSDKDMNKYLLNALMPETLNRETITSKYTICPFCGKATSSYSENWVLVMNENGDKKQLACKSCKGCI